MRSLLFQELVTVRGTGTTSVVQAEPDWLDLGPFADVVFWIEVMEVTSPGGGSVSLSFETAPAKLESLFVPIDTVTAVTPTTVSSGPVVRKVFLNATAGVPLGRFLRWKLVGTTAGTWDVTFRVHVTLGGGIRNAFSPLLLPGLVLWLRADQGVLTSGSAVTQWSDLSGNLNHVTQSVGGSRPALVQNAIGGRPAIDFAGAKFLDSTATNLVGAGSAYSVLLLAKNGSGALFTIRRGTVYSSTKFHLSNTYIFGDGSSGTANMTVANTLAETQSAGSAFKSAHVFKGAGTWPDVYLNTTKRNITSAAPPTTCQTVETGAQGIVVGTNAAGEAWGGLIAEVIVTASSITDTERKKVELYQRDFFGV